MIGERIKQARIELNWTQAMLAFILKVSKSCVSSWERNKQVPNKKMQRKLERVLKIKFQEEETKKQEKNSIGSIIQQARKAKKLTQKELANKLEVSASSISSWENNKSTPNAKMQEKLCQILGLDITNLEDRKVRPNKKQVKKQKEAKNNASEAKNVENEVLSQNNASEAKNVENEEKETLNKENEAQNIANDVTDALNQNDVTENQEENDNEEYRILPLGESDFEEIIEENMYYIDHTRVIRDIIKSSGKIKLMTRPRRFGKTLTLNMLQCFFEYGGNPNLFQNLEITKYPEICQKHQNQYPVVFLTFKDVEAPNFETARAMLCKAIYEEAGRFVFLRESPQLDEEDIQQYNELRQGREMQDDSINTSLKTLIRLLYKHYGKKVVVLIDEYDVPLTKAYHENYYSQMLPLIRSLLSNGLKDNKALKFAVITGCLKISKESIFTGLNNVSVYSMLSDFFADSFGFTKKEVKELLEYYKLEEKYAIIKEWYDGYRIGKEDIYCPWDVLLYVNELCANKNANPKAYWINTSSNDIIRTLLEKYGKKIQDKLLSLLNGETIINTLNENIVYNTLYESIDSIWSVLFATGYLRIEEKISEETIGEETIAQYKLRLPNKEIRIVFRNFFEKWVIESYKQGTKKEQLKKFCDAIVQGNIEEMESFLNNFLVTTTSIQDYSRPQEQRESWYHGILIGLLQPEDARWYCNSNIETGDGYADILLCMRDGNAGIIIELKYARSENLEHYCQEAIQQINEKNYIAYFRNRKYKEVVKYAIAFFRKNCKVLREKEILDSKS